MILPELRNRIGGAPCRLCFFAFLSVVLMRCASIDSAAVDSGTSSDGDVDTASLRDRASTLPS